MNMLELHERSANTIYIVSQDHRITYFNPAYARFAAENDRPDLLQRWGLGASVLDCVPEPMKKPFKRFYAQAFAGRTVEHEYTCHSPAVHRQYLLRLVPDRDNRVIAEHSLIVQHPHRGITDIDPRATESEYTHDTGLVIQCCNCNKVRSAADPSRWDLVRAFIGRTRHAISHGLCSVCIAQLYADLATAGTESPVLADGRSLSAQTTTCHA